MKALINKQYAHTFGNHNAPLNNLWINLKRDHNEIVSFKTRIINLLHIKICGMQQKQLLETHLVGVNVVLKKILKTNKALDSS